MTLFSNAGRSSSSIALVFGALLATLASTEASVAEDARRATSPDSALAVTLASIEGEPISLEDAVRHSLGEATRVREATAAADAAEGALRRERGAFDPVLFADFDLAEEDVPPASPFTGDRNDRTSASAGARIRLPIGTEVEASVETQRLETNSEYAFLDPQYTSNGRIEARQPLLEGFGASASSERTSAELELEAAISREEEAVLQVVADVTIGYWDLYAAERDYAVQRLIVERAETLLREAELRAEAGLVGPADVATARAFLAEQKLAEFDREEALDEFSDALASEIGRRPAGIRYRPTTEPSRAIPVEPLAPLLDRAFRANRELAAAKRELQSAEVRARAAKWDALPELDLTGSLGGNGLAGNPQDVGFGGSPVTVTEGDLSDALSQTFHADFPSWSVGLHLSWPIGSREEGGERDRLRAEVERARERVIDQRRSIEEEVRAAHRRMTNGARRLEIALEGVNASLEQVRIGQIEFSNGRTNAFELVRLGADVAEAQQRYSQALVRTAKAAAELERLAPRKAPDPGRKP